MTDADLARWEHDVNTVPVGMATYDAADVILPLIAEVRRLRAELHAWQRGELASHQDCTAERCVAPNP